MIEEKIKNSIEFTQELSDWFNKSLPDLITEVKNDNDPEFYNDEPLLTFEQDSVIVSENKVKSKIADMLLENRISDYIFLMEYEKSTKEQVVGYG